MASKGLRATFLSTVTKVEADYQASQITETLISYTVCYSAFFLMFNHINFNRQYPDISTQIAEQVKERLGSSAAENVARIRRVAGKILPHKKSVYKRRLTVKCFGYTIQPV